MNILDIGSKRDYNGLKIVAERLAYSSWINLASTLCPLTCTFTNN